MTRAALALLGLVVCVPSPLGAQTPHREIITSSYHAAEIYETGFAHDVLLAPDRGSVILNDMVLIDSDGPGAGYSQKGDFLEPIHHGMMARKILHIDDPRAVRTHCVLFMIPKASDKNTQLPFGLTINGRVTASRPLSWHEPQWHWIEFPVQWLVRGENEVVVSCDAPEGEGYDLLVARADEYEGGGGAFTWRSGTGYVTMGMRPFGHEEDALDPIDVGSTSSRSIDRGATWSGGLGRNADIQGEYTIRLNLERYQPTGELRSNAIDLWSGRERWVMLSPPTKVDSLTILGVGTTPEGTDLEWRVRFADTADMNDARWQEFDSMGSGAAVSWSSELVPYRYAQVAVRLSTTDPLRTPRVQNVMVERTLSWEESALSDIIAVQGVNTSHMFSSYPQRHEDSHHPRLREIREALAVDDIIGDARGDFERINRLRHHVSMLWKHALPEPEYPRWDTLDILARRDRLGWGGMCMQFVIVFMQALQAEGYLSRHINMFAHETLEVFVPELDRWVIVDPESVFDSYSYNRLSGAPLGALEQHEAFLGAFDLSSSNPIRWQAVDAWSWPAPEVNPPPIGFSTMTPHLANPDNPPPQYRLAGFVRMITRSDFLSRPEPVPVNNGLYLPWPWTGYLNWFDEATPRKLQYGIHTDRRVDFYPTVHRVQYTAVVHEEEGKVDVGMFSQTPNLAAFEVNVDGSGWQESDAEFQWQLRRGAVNNIEMRTRNHAGRTGISSSLSVIWHHRPAYAPRGD